MPNLLKILTQSHLRYDQPPLPELGTDSLQLAIRVPLESDDLTSSEPTQLLFLDPAIDINIPYVLFPLVSGPALAMLRV